MLIFFKQQWPIPPFYTMTSQTPPSSERAPFPQTLGIHFKNVGQGDSVVVKWMAEYILPIGIIDCVVDNSGKNHLLQHLKYLHKPYRRHFEKPWPTATHK
jgi:hypothetical protein